MLDTTYDKVLIRKAEAEKFFSVSQSQLSKWIREGDVNHMRGYVNLYSLFCYWRDNKHGVEALETNKSEDERDESLAELKRKIQAEILEEKKLANKKEKGKLVEKEDVLSAWINRLSDLRTGLLSLKHRISHKAAMQEEQEVSKVVEREVDQLFENFSREGKFCENMDKKRD